MSCPAATAYCHEHVDVAERTEEDSRMAEYAVAHLDEIGEQHDGRCPWRPIRHHFGITGFGVNAWTARQAGDRVINEHDESEPDANEELYLVLQGRATFELDGTRVPAPAGTLVVAQPRVTRTAVAEEPGTTIIARRHPGEGVRA